MPIGAPSCEPGFLAQALLLVAAMSCALPACVLPSPPLQKTIETTGLSLSYELVKPVTKQPIVILRGLTSQQPFSVVGAITTNDDRPVNVYWYIDFDPENPVRHKFLGTAITVLGCDTELIGTDGKLVSVEALVTHGDIVEDLVGQLDEHADPRITVDGEPIVRVQWFLRVNGSQELCQPPS